jgi:hypothetical protein
VERNYELRPQPVDAGRAANLTETAFRCGGWSVRAPGSTRAEWRRWSLTERASAVAGVAFLIGVGLAALTVPVALVVGLLRLVGVLP